jgi:beta-phosphoglucomutase-like phosphatase (HAD superfamily)
MYGLIFDMDGVLADTERLSERASIQVLKEACGVDVVASDFHPFIGTGAYRYLEGVAETYGVVIPDIEQAVEARFQYFMELLESGEDISFPGAHLLLGEVSLDSEWTIALATSSPARYADATLRAARIDPEVFSVRVNGDMVTERKPDPAIYNLTLQKLGLQPHQCVVIEDAIAGVQAAKAANCPCIAVEHSFPAEKLSQADRIVPGLTDVNLALLRTLVEQGNTNPGA